MELRKIFFPTVDHQLLVRWRFVAELAVVTGDAELLNQTELRQQFRLAENDFGKNLFVEEIQASRPEPDQINQKNRKYDYGDRDKREKAL